MSLRSRDLSATRRSSIKQSISDTYRRSPHAVKLTRDALSFGGAPSPSLSVSSAQATPFATPVRVGPIHQERAAVSQSQSSQPHHNLNLRALDVLGQDVQQQWRVWLVLLVGFLIAWFLLSRTVGRVGGDADSIPLMGESGDHLSLEDLHKLEARVLALARDAGASEDKALAQRIGALEDAIAKSDHGAKVADMMKQMGLLEALVKELQTSLKEAAATATTTPPAAADNSALESRVDALDRRGSDSLKEVSAQLSALRRRLETVEARPEHPPPPPPQAPSLSVAQIESLISDALRSVHSRIEAAEARALQKDSVASMISSALNPDWLTREHLSEVLDKTLKPLRAEIGSVASKASAVVAPATGTLKKDVEAMIADAMANIRADLSRFALKDHKHDAVAPTPSSSSVATADVEAIVRRMLEVERADVFGRMDYAKSVVLNMTAPTLGDFNAWQKVAARVAGITLVTPPGPEAVVGLGVRHSCWPFRAGGNLTVELTQPLAVSQVVIEHPKKQIARDWQHAPKQFDVYLHQHLNRTGVFAGSFQYDVNKPEAIQLFDLKDVGGARSKYVRFHFASSHGDSFVCLYRVRVFA